MDDSDQGDRSLLSFQRYVVLRNSRTKTHTHLPVQGMLHCIRTMNNKKSRTVNLQTTKQKLHVLANSPKFHNISS